MHSLLFNLKRAHHQSLRFLRHVLRPFAQYKITPARFDFLYAIYRHDRREAFMSDILMALGCVKSNLSRYVKLAEAEDWIHTDWDGRTILMLTPATIALIERILEAVREAVEAQVAQCVDTSAGPENDVFSTRTPPRVTSVSTPPCVASVSTPPSLARERPPSIASTDAHIAPHARDTASVENEKTTRRLTYEVPPDQDRHLAFEHAYRLLYDDRAFLKLRTEARAEVRLATRTKVSADIVQAALRRIRAVFWDARLLDIYGPSFLRCVERFGDLNFHYTEDGWSSFRFRRVC